LKKNKLLVTLSAFGRVPGIRRGLDVRADVSHRETLVLFAGAGRAFPEILFTLIQRQFLSTIDTYVFSRADFLSGNVTLLFSHLKLQNLHSRQRYIWVVLMQKKDRELELTGL
jgi:hypothetical protein